MNIAEPVMKNRRLMHKYVNKKRESAKISKVRGEEYVTLFFKLFFLDCCLKTLFYPNCCSTFCKLRIVTLALRVLYMHYTHLCKYKKRYLANKHTYKYSRF